MSHPLPLVLASASPRRRELLERLGLQLVVAPAAVDETPLPAEAGPLHALRVARAKARTVSPAHPRLPVLAADTVVVLGERLLGKPADRAQAREMLRSLRGRDHEVITAVVARFGGRERALLAQARVRFTAFAEDLLEWYVASGEPDDKAGAYAVQGRGALLVDRVEGNVQAVVGLPLALLPEVFAAVGLRLVAGGERLVLQETVSSRRA